jgi:methionyl-tRNA formyltransferase
VFLGHAGSDFSGRCLKNLLQCPQTQVTVGLYHPGLRNLPNRFVRAYRRRGLARAIQLILELGLMTSSSVFRGLVNRSSRENRAGTMMRSQRAVVHFRANPIHSSKSLEYLKSLRPNLIIVAGYPEILRQEVFMLPALGTLNLHPSLLPKYRGPDPLHWVLKNGESESGITLHYIDRDIDSGDIIYQARFSIKPDDTKCSLVAKSAEAGGALLQRAISELAAGRELPRRPQDPLEATYFGLATRLRGRRD